MRLLLLLAALALPIVPLHAQFEYEQDAVILPDRAGEIVAPSQLPWKLDYTNVYDNGTRPVLQLSNALTGITASLTLFDNGYGKPDPEGCRKDATDGILANQREAISNRKDFAGKAINGTPLAMTSWTIHGNPFTIRQRNLFAFAADAKTCYEVHLSKIEAGKPVDAELARALPRFKIKPAYKPNSLDYQLFGVLLAEKTPSLAVPYYARALTALRGEGGDPTYYRIISDQIMLSLGKQGDYKDAREFAQRAIELDPDYPMSYYLLASFDADQGNAAAARVHLEQAYARQKNNLRGDALPLPAQQESFLKLKGDRDFWAYVLTLR